MTESPRRSAAWIAIGFFLFFTFPAVGQSNPVSGQHSDADITGLYFNWLEKGQTAIPELKKTITSDNWRMRTHALLAMGKTGDRTLSALVMERLANDQHAAVKNCAVTALGDLKETTAVPLLIDLLRQTPLNNRKPPLPQKRVIVQALGKIGDSRAINPLFNLMVSSGNEQLRVELVEAFIAINDPAVSRLILSHKKDAVQFPYVQSAQISGSLPVEGSEAFLISLLQNKELKTQNAAIISLGKIRSEKSVSILLSLFETDNRHLQKNIADALITIDSSSAALPLCDLLSSPDPETAMAAARILTRMTDQTIGQQVFHRFETRDQQNGPAAIVLGRKKVIKAVPELRSRLGNLAETGQDEMAEALGWLDDRESIPLLMKIAARRNKQGAAGAIWSLGHLNAKQAIPLMLKIIKRQDRRLTAPAVFALGDIGDPSTVKPLIDLYYESGLQYQMQIALALVQIGGPEVAEILKTNMESGNPKRRKMAGYMLLKSRDPALAAYAIKLLNHPDESIRRYALGGLKNITGQDFNTLDEWKTWEKQQK